MWALGDYPALAAEIIPALGGVLVSACGVRGGEHVLDVVAGSGNAAIPAALAGASVVACDLTPELFEAGRKRAAAGCGGPVARGGCGGAAVRRERVRHGSVVCRGDVRPTHQASADELIRVCRPGGTLGQLSWTPEGFIGQMFAMMKPFVPPPPPGAQPPPLWGSEDHVRSLLGERVVEGLAHKQTVRVDGFVSAEAFRDYFKTRYGPTVATYRHIAENPALVAALDSGLAELAQRHDQGGEGNIVMDWEYLLLTAHKRD